MHNFPYSLEVTAPPLAATFFKFQPGPPPPPGVKPGQGGKP
jgi:hypothetical protein